MMSSWAWLLLRALWPLVTFLLWCGWATGGLR
jgi:hypothetical protein